MEQAACNLCGSDKYKKLFLAKDTLHNITEEKFQLVKCLVCGLLYLNPRPTPAEIKQYYPDAYAPFKGEQTVFTENVAYQFFKKIVSVRIRSSTETFQKNTEVKTILDYGCGGGKYLARKREEHPHWKFYGLDAVPVAVEIARAKGFEVFCGELEDA